MEASRIGPLSVRALGGTDGRGGGNGPAILLCHGFGAPGDDLVGLARAVDAGPGVRWFFPEGPIALDLGWGTQGRAWWPLDMVRLERLRRAGNRELLASETPDGLTEARAALEATIGALAQSHGVRREALIIGGFSQGAMLTTELALHAATPFAGLAVLSGTVISSGRWAEASAARGASIDALVTHGRADQVLHFAGAEALVALLQKGGAQVEWVPHGGQHEIPPTVLEGLGFFARARFGGLPPA